MSNKMTPRWIEQNFPDAKFGIRNFTLNTIQIIVLMKWPGSHGYNIVPWSLPQDCFSCENTVGIRYKIPLLKNNSINMAQKIATTIIKTYITYKNDLFNKKEFQSEFWTKSNYKWNLYMPYLFHISNMNDDVTDV